jgi:hypothetical protein
MLKKSRNHLAADQRRLTPIENQPTYPRSSAFICGLYVFFSNLLMAKPQKPKPKHPRTKT